MEDYTIIELFFARNERAIRETDEKYGRLCRRVAYNILNDDRDCEECISDTYLTLWNTIPPQKPANFTAFVCKITRNLSLKKLEYNTAKKRDSRLEISLAELEETLPDTRFTADAEEESVGALVNQFLRKQKKNVRNVFIRRYYFFDGIAEIAARYGYGESKVKSMLFHTRNKLKKFLEERGVCV